MKCLNKSEAYFMCVLLIKKRCCLHIQKEKKHLDKLNESYILLYVKTNSKGIERLQSQWNTPFIIQNPIESLKLTSKP